MIDQTINFNIANLSGASLTFLGIGEFQITLGFGDTGSISSEYQVRRIWPGDQIVFPPPPASAPILDLLGQSIRKASLDENESISLEFSNGTVLRVECQNEGYESYQIHIGSDFLIA